MEIHYQVKELGKKHPAIQNQSIEIELETTSPTVEVLLRAIITEEVRAYHNRQESKSLLTYLSSKEVQNQVNSGKVSFGESYNDTKVERGEAIKTALQAFKDGLFALFYDDNELSYLHEIVDIHEHGIITFIRLTFLTGSIW